MIILIDIFILTMLALTALTVARIRDLWAAVMFFGIYSFLGASWMLLLDAPDVAFTEAAVGAGISTFLMLGTLALTSRTQKPLRELPVMPLLVVAGTGAALIYGTLDMPHFGDPDAPVHTHLDPGFMERSQAEMHGLPNVVTAILASYRGYDTLGETAVIFTAGVGVLLILRRERPLRQVASASPGPTVQSFPIIRVVAKLLIPYILLFALYVQFHGDYGPGGGFQAGVILASALILYGLVFGLPAVHRVAPPWLIEKLIALGLLVYAGTGVITMLLGGNFLDYDVLEHHFLTELPAWPPLWSEPLHFLPSGQHLGIFLVEVGVGITVTSVMTMIFYLFAGRRAGNA
jgi:multicomponent Na+:H+ antiporter subunit B